jgi:hypothetical protein
VRGGRFRPGAAVSQQVPPIREPEDPGQLDLAEGKEGAGGGRYLLLTLIAYLLGAIGTTGSGIWLMWLIS